MEKRKGFTLIELLVVVAIMGLLAASAVVAFNSARQRARDARRVSDIRQIQTALELYYLDQSGYPTPPTGGPLGDNYINAYCLDDTGFKTSCGTGTTYMAVVPANPKPWEDGDCADPSTGYLYTRADVTTYSIEYCIGSKTGQVSAGTHFATPAGLATP